MNKEAQNTVLLGKPIFSLHKSFISELRKSRPRKAFASWSFFRSHFSAYFLRPAFLHPVPCLGIRARPAKDLALFQEPKRFSNIGAGGKPLLVLHKLLKSVRLMGWSNKLAASFSLSNKYLFSILKIIDNATIKARHF